MTAFLVIAVGGGLGGYWFFFHQVPAIAPMTVERAAVVEQGAPQSEPKPPAPQEPAAPPAEPKPEAKPPEPAAVQTEPKPEAKEPAPKEPVAPPAEAKAEAKPPVPQEPKETPKPRPHRVARADPPAPIVIVKEAPEQPKQIVTAKGELVLLIRPWAKVEVDGLEVGITPLNEPLMLAAGEHTVRLINADLQKDIVKTVHITASEKEVLKAILDE
jgi:outer membrane biosynthesis protein TonB